MLSMRGDAGNVKHLTPSRNAGTISLMTLHLNGQDQDFYGDLDGAQDFADDYSEGVWTDDPTDDRELDQWAAAWEEDASNYPDDAYPDDDYNPWNDVEQGRFDDDPSPYNGDYSEM